MLIFRLSQNECIGYDTYDACIVIAPTEERAKELSIDKVSELSGSHWPKDPSKIDIELIGGSSLGEQIILASYNAG